MSRELILPPQSHFAGTAGEGDECDKFLAMWLQQRQTGRRERERGNQLNQGHLLLLPSSSASWSRWVSYGRMQ